jgi:hypothetical protein
LFATIVSTLDIMIIVKNFDYIKDYILEIKLLLFYYKIYNLKFVNYKKKIIFLFLNNYIMRLKITFFLILNKNFND